MRNLAVSILVVASLAHADVPVETLGQVEDLPEPFSPHWFWASDPILERVSLVDYTRNAVLGSVDGGWGITVPLFPQQDSREFYVPETYYSRGTRGERTDLVAVYDSVTLTPVAEIIIPPKRAHNALPNANAMLTDDEQFVAVFNMTPAQSISIVDVGNRRFVEEIPTPGCSLTYPAGERRIMMICGDGALLFLTLDSDGSLLHKQRTEPFFDPQKDPITEKGVRVGDTWHFVSFEGYLYSVDTAAPIGRPRRDVSPAVVAGERRRTRGSLARRRAAVSRHPRGQPDGLRAAAPGRDRYPQNRWHASLDV
jgi:methylamine dehydrogenase heavy chain